METSDTGPSCWFGCRRTGGHQNRQMRGGSNVSGNRSILQRAAAHTLLWQPFDVPFAWPQVTVLHHHNDDISCSRYLSAPVQLVDVSDHTVAARAVCASVCRPPCSSAATQSQEGFVLSDTNKPYFGMSHHPFPFQGFRAILRHFTHCRGVGSFL